MEKYLLIQVFATNEPDKKDLEMLNFRIESFRNQVMPPVYNFDQRQVKWNSCASISNMRSEVVVYCGLNTRSSHCRPFFKPF